MNLSAIATARLISQQIEIAKFTRPKDLVAYMGAIQAQDYAMCKWAIGLRLPGLTENEIEKSLDKGEIIRTHVLRPTWHIIPAADVYWMLMLTADRIKAVGKTMNKYLGLTEKMYTKSNTVIEKSLRDGKHLTREEIAANLEKVGIDTGNMRLMHLLLRAELEEITCSGKMDGNKKTYTLLADRVRKKTNFTREEALAMLAKKYFSSHGPATAEDFSWWSGLSLSEARQGLEMVKHKFIAEKINGKMYWFSAALNLVETAQQSVHLLPAYDEFLISYKDRLPSLIQKHNKKIISVNGIFNPIIVVNGQVTGLWKRNFEKDKVIVETGFFQPHSKAIRSLVEKEVEVLAQFTGMKTEVIFKNWP